MIIRPGKTAPCELFDGSRVIAEGTWTHCDNMRKVWTMTADSETPRIIDLELDARKNAGKTE